MTCISFLVNFDNKKWIKNVYTCVFVYIVKQKTNRKFAILKKNVWRLEDINKQTNRHPNRQAKYIKI